MNAVRTPSPNRITISGNLDQGPIDILSPQHEVGEISRHGTLLFDNHGHETPITPPFPAVEAPQRHPSYGETMPSSEGLRVAPAGLAGKGIANWLRQKIGRGNKITSEAHEKQSEVDSFWSEKHAAVTARSFSEQVAEALTQPNTRQNIINSDPKLMLPNASQHESRRTKASFTEREGVIDLDNFLLQVVKASEGQGDRQSREMSDMANRMRQNFNFLGKEEYNAACKGIANAWKDYLVKHPKDGYINVFDPPVSEDGPKKSYNVVLSDIKKEFDNLLQDRPDLVARLRTNPKDWRDSKNAKLIVVDDWITSGNTISNNAAKAMRTAREIKLSGLVQKTEAHLLISRQGESRRPWQVGDGNQFTLRSYYETATNDPNASPSGSHSSVDYTFETPLGKMNDYLKTKGVYREKPLLTHIERNYDARGDHYRDAYDEAMTKSLTEIGKLNDILNTLDAEKDSLQKGKMTPESFALLNSNRDSAAAVKQRIDMLADEYSAAKSRQSEIMAHNKKEVVNRTSTPSKVSAFDLEGTLLRPERPLHHAPHSPEDFYNYSGRLLHALAERGHDTVLITRAEQQASERLVQHAGVPTAVGSVAMNAVLGGERALLSNGLRGIVESKGDKGNQLRGYVDAYHRGDAMIDIAVGDTLDDAPMLAMARKGVAINPEGQFFAVARDRGFTIVQEDSKGVTISNPGSRPKRVSHRKLNKMTSQGIIGLLEK
ncbi:MAG TPA: hypothetical protein VF733_01830 [Candidatus Saccharimonadales bacterium]